MCSILYLTSYQSTEEPFRRQVEQREREREREYMETKVFIIDKQYREKEKGICANLMQCSFGRFFGHTQFPSHFFPIKPTPPNIAYISNTISSLAIQ
jgi:hypothetical protein